MNIPTISYSRTDAWPESGPPAHYPSITQIASCLRCSRQAVFEAKKRAEIKLGIVLAELALKNQEYEAAYKLACSIEEKYKRIFERHRHDK